MATATYNQTDRTIRFDLSAIEIALIDALIAEKGITPIEGVVNNLLRDCRQRKREQDVAKIRAKIDSLTDTQRQQILVLLT